MFFLTFLIFIFFSSSYTLDVYVDCLSGSDTSGSGSTSSPYLSPSRARDFLRTQQPLSVAAFVYLRGDCYPRDVTSDAIDFSGDVLGLSFFDSGPTPDASITYTTWPSSPSPARLLGGLPIPAAAWSPYPAIPGVWQANLGPSGLNISHYGFGSLGAGGLGQCTDSGIELFYNDQPAILSRYPNILPNGTWQWMNIAKVYNPQSSFVVNGSDGQRVLRWASEKAAWLHGYWSYDWADSYVEIANITAVPEGALIDMSPGTAPVYGFLATARFYGTNIFSELDAASEYYIDSVTGMLYFFPPPGANFPAEGDAFVSIAEYVVAAVASKDAAGRVPFFRAVDHVKKPQRAPLRPPAVAATHAPSARASMVSNVNFVGLQLSYARTAGIALGTAENITITNCTLTNHGHNAATLSGRGLEISYSTAYGMGCQAFSLYGGDLSTLTGGNTLFTGNEMSNYARTVRTYNPGLGWGGVGLIVSNNHIHHAPHNGMLGGGALSLFEGNLFDSLCYEATDSGSFYVGYSWVAIGNVIRGNTFVNIRNKEKMTLGYAAVQAIYLDDQQSGYAIIENTCIDSQTCWFVGGGRDVVVSGNTCVSADLCVHVDDRGLNWEHDGCNYNASFTPAGGIVGL